MGQPGKDSFASQFTKRRDPSCKVSHDDQGEWLEVGCPTQLANFVAFCKKRGRRVYLRGQSSRHPTLVPSLFRDTKAAPHTIWSAYRDFVE